MMLSLLRTPWRVKERPSGDRVLVFVSRFDAAGLRSSLRLMRYSPAIGRAARTAPGCIGSALLARPVKGAYYTVSYWQDEESLKAFTRQRPHRAGVKALHAAGPVDGVLISWWADATARRPRWSEVMHRADVSARGRYAGPQPASPGDAAPAAVA